MIKKSFENLKLKQPLIHNITNYVTVNDCANVLLACGASPIMADDISEVAKITSICSGLNLNIGTLNKNTIESMIAAGKTANALSHPILLDPVGAGASTLRTQTAQQLFNELNIAVIRGNISEIKTLALGYGNTTGVDANVAEIVTDETIGIVVDLAKRLSASSGSIVAITGVIDIVANGEKACVIRNGHKMMSKVTGTGCMLSAMTTAYICANPKDMFWATVASTCAMGLCGELAFERLTPRDGNITYRNYIIDEIYNLTAEKLELGAKYEVY